MAIKKNTNDLISQAATTLADNSTQDISPQDIREMAENNAFSSYNKITDNNLVGLKNYSTAATYEAAQGVVYNGSIYISNTIPTPGAFNASEWDILVGGEINTSSNSGTGEGLALAKSGSNLPFKSLTAGTGITLTSAANELQISSDSGEVNTSSNSGTGEGLALAKSGSNLPFKSLTAGTGITLTSAANELQISSAGGTDTNIGNSNITFDATYNADLNGNDWSIKDGSDTLLSVKNTGEISIGLGALNNSTADKSLNVLIGKNAKIGTTSGNYTDSIAIGNSAIVQSVNCIAIGETTAAGNTSINIGTNNTSSGHTSASIGKDNQSLNDYAISIGKLNKALSRNSIAIGEDNEAGQRSITLGENNRLSGQYSAGIGRNINNQAFTHTFIVGSGASNTAGTYLEPTASNQFVVGFNSANPTMLIGATTDSYIKSTGNLSLETNTTVKGSDNSAATSGFKVTDVNDLSLLDIKNDGSFIIGKGATNNNVLSKNQNVLIGQNATIGAGNSEKAISIGYNASATLTNSIAIGGTATTGGVSIGVGSVAGGVAVALLGSATSDFSIGIGSGASSSNTGAISIGKSAVSSAQYTTSLGYEAESTSNFAIALGWNTESNAYMGLSLGSATEVNHAGSIVLGTGFSAGASALKSTSTNQLTVGFNSATPTMVIGATTDSYIKSTGNLSLETDTTVKGSDTLVGTTGFKVTDVNNLSLLEVRNSGVLKLQYLPSLPAGTVAGDVWSQNGTLRIGNPTANIQTEVSAATITPNIDTTKLVVTSALAAALTIAAPTGTAQEGQELTFRFKDDGTARALTWNAIFEDYTGSLPTTTTAGKTVYIGCKYNLINTKWDVVAVQNQP